MKKILLIDNFDSFSYNLYQLFGEFNQNIEVVRNTISIKEIEKINPSAIILSPGPKTPNEAGICLEAIKYFGSKLPILGICLGHQSIAQAFGAKIIHAPKVMHGKISMINVDNSSAMFKNLEPRIQVARYHSLVAQNDTISDEIKITAKTDDDIIMALEHKKYKIYGLQFHPESILTTCGRELAKNFLEQIK